MSEKRLYRTIAGPPEELAFTHEQLENYLAEVRREAMLEVCQMQCWMCEEHKEIVVEKSKYFHKMNGWVAECSGNAVRKLADSQHQPGQGSGEDYTEQELKCTGCMGPCGNCEKEDK